MRNGRVTFLRSAIPALALGIAAAALPGGAAAEDKGRVTVIEENDSIINNTDKHYTQGIRFSYLSGDVTPGGFWDAPFEFFGGFTPIFPSGAGERSRRYSWIVLGQSLFTPKDTELSVPDPRDRPYAGWLYTGVGLIQDTNRRQLDHLELLLGVVGPASLGRETQNDYHQLIGVSTANGWSHQIHNEPGLMLSYEHKWRLYQPLAGGLALDFIPEIGATVGNVMTYGQVGAMVRFGKNLEADYGSPRIRPGLSGTDYFNGDYLDGDFGFYVYAGAQPRIVGRNIFLDGNSFRSSPSVDKENFVVDFVGGVALFWSTNIRADFSVVTRTKEFEGQHGNDAFAGVNISFGFW